MSFGRKRTRICRRRSWREGVMLAASALAVTRSRSVLISDLSATGARLRGADLPQAGDDVLMVAGSTDRMGRVVWRSLDRCGIRFDQPLPGESIALMKQEARWAAVTGWAS